MRVNNFTCYGCGEAGPTYQVCTKKRGKGRVSTTGNKTTYAEIAAHGTPPRPESPEKRTEGEVHTKHVSQSEDPMEETNELMYTDRQLPSGCAADPQTEQSRGMTHTDDGKDEATCQQQAGGQEAGEAMEIRETKPSTLIPRLTKIIRSGITFVSRNVISRRFI